jgi:hypothetical protein
MSSAFGSDSESSPPDVPRLTYSDADLEEISLLGEGTDAVVHKVKDKRNGQIMARKTIPTRGTPINQLLHELCLSSSAVRVHRNIISFYGTYTTPSSGEVKILMEFCEGGSLEAVGKRIKERGGIVGELIAGHIAEGVSHSRFSSRATTAHQSAFVGPPRSRVSAQQKNYPSRHQTIKHPLLQGRRRHII